MIKCCWNRVIIKALFCRVCKCNVNRPNVQWCCLTHLLNDSENHKALSSWELSCQLWRSQRVGHRSIFRKHSLFNSYNTIYMLRYATQSSHHGGSWWLASVQKVWEETWNAIVNSNSNSNSKGLYCHTKQHILHTNTIYDTVQFLN